MKVQSHFPLKSFNTFGLDCQAQSWVEVASSSDMRECIASGLFAIPGTLILGGGSNVLFTQSEQGTVVKMAIPGIRVSEEDSHFAIVQAGAGVVWHDLVLWSLQQGLSGIENLSLIPGSVGAAPIQNIGAYGVELKDVFHSLEAMNLQTGEIMVFDLEACRFGYRDSYFKREGKGLYAILQVSLRLPKTPQLNVSYGAIQDELARTGKSTFTPRDVSDAVIRIRQSKLPDPVVIGNAGSFFKNPEIPQQQYDELKLRFPALPSYPGSLPGYIKLPAGWLIEQAGWKGRRFGSYGVHALQALVLVNYGGATGREILDLSSQILEDIHQKFGIELEREVNVV